MAAETFPTAGLYLSAWTSLPPFLSLKETLLMAQDPAQRSAPISDLQVAEALPRTLPQDSILLLAPQASDRPKCLHFLVCTTEAAREAA